MGNALLAAGRLDRRVTIVRPTRTQNASNEWIEGEPSRTQVWASMKPGPGTERFQNAEVAAEAPMRFVFRWRADLVRVSDRLEADDGQTYEVLWRAEIGRREGLEALAVARAETA